MADDPAKRLAVLQHEAARRCVNVSVHVAAIERRVAAVEARLFIKRERPAATEAPRIDPAAEKSPALCGSRSPTS